MENYKVVVWKRYTGVRVETPIETGEYKSGDPKLQGLEVYLRDNGNARFIEIDEPKRRKKKGPEAEKVK